jgi:hypothetical protein
MRCPKCGYISFDHLEKCVKCNKDIKGISFSLFGSTYNIQPPRFLKLPQEKIAEPSELNDIEDESFEEVGGYVDEELDILIEDDESEAESNEVRAKPEFSRSSGADEEEEHEGEIEIDFSQFEEAGEPEVNLFDENDAEEETQQEEILRPRPAMELPAELSDMSDLAHPGKRYESERPAGKSSTSDLSELELDDLYFDLGLDGLEEDQPAKKGKPEEAVLSLDDLDFSDVLVDGSSAKKSGGMGMDEDLDFDLDLGGLSIHKDVK